MCFHVYVGGMHVYQLEKPPLHMDCVALYRLVAE